MRSIRTQLLALVCGSVIAVFGILAGMVMINYRGLVESTAKEEMILITDKYSEELNDMFSTVERACAGMTDYLSLKPDFERLVRDKEYADGNISRGALLNADSRLIASYGPDGLLDLPFRITSFKVNVNGMLTEARGNKFTSDQRDRMSKLKMGAIVVITDIRAQGPDGREIRLSPIPLSLN